MDSCSRSSLRSTGGLGWARACWASTQDRCAKGAAHMSLRKLGTRNEVRPSGPRLNDGFSAASASSFFAGITDGATLRLRRGRPHGKPASRPETDAQGESADGISGHKTGQAGVRRRRITRHSNPSVFLYAGECASTCLLCRSPRRPRAQATKRRVAVSTAALSPARCAAQPAASGSRSTQGKCTRLAATHATSARPHRPVRRSSSRTVDRR